jgi:alpha-beta hydrolase superfamily lysophospholipase
MERYFTISDGHFRVPCKISEPDFGALRRCILGVHGFGANKDTHVLSALAEEMSVFGAATVCFDFPAHGESPMQSDTLTLPNCIDTLLYTARWARNRYPDLDFCVFASGFGAYVTLIAIDQLEELVGPVKLVLQTPNLRMSETILNMTRMSEAQLLEAGHATLNAERKFDISYDFYKQVRNYTALTIYDTPMLLLHGEKDEYLPLEDMVNFRRINEGCKLVVVPEADHQFLTPGAWDMVLDLTRDWFEFEQVLLCDWS